MRKNERAKEKDKQPKTTKKDFGKPKKKRVATVCQRVES